MSYLVDAAGEHLRATFAGVKNDTPMTLAAWVKKTDWDANFYAIMQFGTNFTSQDHSQMLQQNGVVDRAAASSRTTSTANAEYDFTTDAYNGVWVPVVGTFTNSIRRDVYINSVSETASDTNSASVNHSLDSISLGARVNDTFQWGDLIAHCCIWDQVLSGTDITAFMDATSQADIEAIDSANQYGYWPLNYDNSTQTNEWGASDGDITVTNATYSSDDPFSATTSDINFSASNRGIMRGVGRGVG